MKSRAKKWLGGILLGIVVLLVALLAAAWFLADEIVEQAVRKGGPAILGVPVTLGGADIQILRGQLGIEDLVIGNPEGFQTEQLFSLGKVEVDMDTASVFSDVIHIRSIRIVEPEITYERRLRSSNIGALMEKLEGGGEEGEEPTGEPEAAENKTPEEGGKKVVIDEVRIEGAKVRVSGTLMAGRALTVPLPTIVMRDIGKEKGGASLGEAIGRILKAVATAVTDAVAAALKAVGQGVEAVGEAAVGGAKAAVGVVGGAAGAVGETGKDAVKAVGTGVKSVVGGVKGLFTDGADGGDEKKPEPAPETAEDGGEDKAKE
jgi:hypothetical protein